MDIPSVVKHAQAPFSFDISIATQDKSLQRNDCDNEALHGSDIYSSTVGDCGGRVYARGRDAGGRYVEELLVNQLCVQASGGQAVKGLDCIQSIIDKSAGQGRNGRTHPPRLSMMD